MSEQAWTSERGQADTIVQNVGTLHPNLFSKQSSLEMSAFGEQLELVSCPCKVHGHLSA